MLHYCQSHTLSWYGLLRRVLTLIFLNVNLASINVMLWCNTLSWYGLLTWVLALILLSIHVLFTHCRISLFEFSCEIFMRCMLNCHQDWHIELPIIHQTLLCTNVHSTSRKHLSFPCLFDQTFDMIANGNWFQENDVKVKCVSLNKWWV